MRGIQKALAAGSLFTCATVAFAAESESPFSANVAIASEYVWRGVSQSAEDPAIQGGFDFAHASGFYLGVWGSNVDFEDQAIDGAQTEMDVFGGYQFKAGPVDLDVGFIRYIYPGAAGALEYDFTEGYVGVGYGIFSAKYSYSPDFWGVGDDSASYLEAALSFELPQGFGLGLHVGQSSGEAFDVIDAEYIDYKVSVGKEYAGFGFDVSYIDTDVSGANEIKSGAFANDARVVLTVSKSL